MVQLFEPFVKNCGVVILDGAMATELENRGADLHNPLWSATLLIENPTLIKQVHLDYLQAGAQVITTASYQASFDGFTSRGYTKEKAIELMRLATTLALEARAEAVLHNLIKGPLPLVAASVGPYGASRADGSEYSGYYGLSVEQLMSWHRERILVLKESGADLLACETIPCAEEAIALINLMKEFPDLKAWLSFSCKNETQICSGASFKECIAMVNGSSQVVAVGVNCTPPQFVESLVRIAVAVSNKPVLAYPNKGDTWDGKNKCWLPGEVHVDFISEAIRWRNAGATLIGGCCRTSPEDIKQIRKQLCAG